MSPFHVKRLISVSPNIPNHARSARRFDFTTVDVSTKAIPPFMTVGKAHLSRRRSSQLNPAQTRSDATSKIAVELMRELRGSGRNFVVS